MATTEALWMANRDGQAALALAPLASAPARLSLRGARALLDLADGAVVQLAESAADGIGRMAEAAGAVSIFEVDATGRVRRATRVDVARCDA
jgi:hypothetical protein